LLNIIPFILNYTGVFVNLHTVMKTVLTATDEIQSEAFTRCSSVDHRERLSPLYNYAIICLVSPNSRDGPLCAVHTMHTTGWNTFYRNVAEYITTYFYWLFPQNCNFSKVRHRRPDDGPGGPKHVEAIRRWSSCIF